MGRLQTNEEPLTNKGPPLSRGTSRIYRHVPTNPLTVYPQRHSMYLCHVTHSSAYEMQIGNRVTAMLMTLSTCDDANEIVTKRDVLPISIR
jgi:hypothetical protein